MINDTYRITRLRDLGLTLCSWKLDFLTARAQAVRMGNNTSSTLTLSTAVYARLRGRTAQIQ